MRHSQFKIGTMFRRGEIIALLDGSRLSPRLPKGFLHAVQPIALRSSPLRIDAIALSIRRDRPG